MRMVGFRLDRAVTLGLVQPVRRAFAASHPCRIPVLMYHGVNNVRGKAHPYFETNTSPNVFARQMQQLHESGYRPVNLETAFHMVSSGTSQPGTVAITFDDGFRDFYTHAMPILQDHQFPATMFVVSSFVGTRQTHFDGKEFMTWNELREIQSSGIEIGSHTVRHPQLYSLQFEDVERELTTSKRTIEDRLGERVKSFSYPFAFPEQDGAFVSKLRQCLQHAEYDSGVTTVLGSADRTSDRYFYPRIPVNDHDDTRLFQAKLEGAYDWLHTPQLIYKSLRKLRQPANHRRQGQTHKSSIVTEL
jgi:peptidoglycan/xylan/chitin deacetylase (PgdA/CDA1 family)